MRPYYRKDGRYKGGRVRISIESLVNGKTVKKRLPKPEIMLEIMNGSGWKEILKEIKGEKGAGKTVH